MGEENAEGSGRRYRVELVCDGVPPDAGGQAAIDIKDEFGQRPSHANVKCEWNGTALFLTAENDYDSEGRTLMDEFSDAIAACIVDGFDGSIRVVSVKEL